MKEFDIEDLEFFLPDSFKGMSKEYLLSCIFDEKIQKNWNPGLGDVIVGSTGNIFVISGSHNLVPELGGKSFFFGGGFCNRDGGRIMDSTYCSVLNKDGIEYRHTREGIKQFDNLNYSKFSDFRYVPYPHEK